jgi:ATP-dependent DNA ligase
MLRVFRPAFIQPQLPTPTDQPPKGSTWIHEVKHDGFRTILVVDRERARAYSRNGFDWTDRYLGIVAAAARLPCRTAILDGEVIVQDKRGASDFEALQEALRSRRVPLIFYSFDLLHLDGKDIRERPLLERREKLKALLGNETSSALQFSEEFVGDAAAFFRACAEHKLEGIVSKLARSPYRSGRTKAWLKTKCFAESELTLLGIDRDRKTGALRALLAKSERGKSKP